MDVSHTRATCTHIPSLIHASVLHGGTKVHMFSLLENESISSIAIVIAEIDRDQCWGRKSGEVDQTSIHQNRMMIALFLVPNLRGNAQTFPPVSSRMTIASFLILSFWMNSSNSSPMSNWMVIASFPIPYFVINEQDSFPIIMMLEPGVCWWWGFFFLYALHQVRKFPFYFYSTKIFNNVFIMVITKCLFYWNKLSLIW